MGAGYIGLEMAEALTARGLHVTQLEQLPEVLPTVDPELGALVHAELEHHGVEVLTAARSTDHPRPSGEAGRLQRRGHRPRTAGRDPARRPGPRRCRRPPRHRPRRRAGAALGVQGRDRRRPQHANQSPRRLRRRRLRRHPSSAARRDLPSARHDRPQAGPRRRRERPRRHRRVRRQLSAPRSSKVFDLVAARTGLRDHEALAAGLRPAHGRVTKPTTTRPTTPAATRITMRYTGDRSTGRLLGVQLVGHRHARSPNASTSPPPRIFHRMTVDELSDLDLSYTPPLGSPWDAIQIGAQAWLRGSPATREGHVWGMRLWCEPRRGDEAPDPARAGLPRPSSLPAAVSAPASSGACPAPTASQLQEALTPAVPG